MSWVRIWVHLVFATRRNERLLINDHLRALTTHIQANAKNKGIWLDTIGGSEDHIHCLISLRNEQSISKIAQLIKGESSSWMNKNYFERGKALWKRNYWSVSICENQIKGLREYIGNQEIVHHYLSFQEEIKILNLPDIEGFRNL